MALAELLGLSEASLLEALEKETFMSKVREDFRGGLMSGVNGTPAFFIDGARHDGSFEFEHLAAAISATRQT